MGFGEVYINRHKHNALNRFLSRITETQWNHHRLSLFFFLGYLLLLSTGNSFIRKSFYFIAYNISNSQSVVSLVGSISATAFLLVGCFAGIIVDAYSRKFFIYFETFVSCLLSFIVLFLYQYNALSLLLFFAYVFILEVINTFSQASKNSIYFDIWGKENIASSIVYRNVTLTVASILSSLILSYVIVDKASFPMIYIAFSLLSIILFRLTNYQDQNQKQQFSGFIEILYFIKSQFIQFLLYCFKNKMICLLFAFSFIKTVLIYWAMTSGTLFKLGIDREAGQKLFVIVLAIMDVVTIISTLTLGKIFKSFNLQYFNIGIIICGIGIFLFSLSDNTIISIIFLSLLYIGLAVSQLALGYITRMEFKEEFRTQGLSFAVIPYYTADIFSGLLYAYLIHLFVVDSILFYTGLSLIGFGTAFIVLTKGLKR